MLWGTYDEDDFLTRRDQRPNWWIGVDYKPGLNRVTHRAEGVTGLVVTTGNRDLRRVQEFDGVLFADTGHIGDSSIIADT